jgi:hypothetical protein
VTGEVNHSRHGGLSKTTVGAAKEVGAMRATAVEAKAARTIAIGAAWGRNLKGTARAGRGATSRSNPRGTFGAGWQGAMVPTVVSRVPTVETVEPDSQRKSTLVGLGEAARGKLSSSKIMCRETIRRFVERSR